MEPILRRWFAIDLDPVNLDSNAENAAVDLSWALESAGLLLPIELVVPEERAPTQTKVGDQVDWRAMALRRAAAPPRTERQEDIARAIATIEDSRQTHVEWIDYLAKHGDDLRPHEEIAGDAGHHRETVEQYEQVLSVLRASAAPVPEGVPEDRIAPEGWRWKWCDCTRSEFGTEQHPVWFPDTPHGEGEQP